MKQLHLLIWITQLGLSIAVPLAGFVLLSVWLRSRFGWGDWVLLAGILLGLVTAVDSFRIAMKAMQKSSHSTDEPPTAAFNDHT